MMAGTQTRQRAAAKASSTVDDDAKVQNDDDAKARKDDNAAESCVKRKRQIYFSCP